MKHTMKHTMRGFRWECLNDIQEQRSTACEELARAYENSCNEATDESHLDHAGKVAHMAGITNRKGRGSYVEGVCCDESFERFLSDIIRRSQVKVVSHADIEAVAPGTTMTACTYVWFTMPTGYTAFQSITTLSKLMADYERGEVLPITIRRSPHDTTMVDEDGKVVMGDNNKPLKVPSAEFVTNEVSTDHMQRATEGWFIIGPGDNKKQPIIWTWYPGPLTSSPQRHLIDTLAGIVVKVQGGEV